MLAVVGGVGIAVLFNQSRLVEYSFYPYAVILQVTPVVAIAPLLLVYMRRRKWPCWPAPGSLRSFRCSPTPRSGSNSVDRNLADLFRLYGASRFQVLWRLKLPAALPYILGGLKIAGGLSLDRCSGRGDGGKLCRRRLRPRLPHRGVRLPAEHPAHVCGAGAALRCGHRDLSSRWRWSRICYCGAGTKVRWRRTGRSPERQPHRDPQRRHDHHGFDQPAVKHEREQRPQSPRAWWS